VDERLNVFQLWDQCGRRLPIKVVKETWARNPGHYFLLERVEVGKWPYGSAWGRYHQGGSVGDSVKLRNAGTFTWHLYDLEGSEERPLLG
jgi:hypothetical protein